MKNLIICNDDTKLKACVATIGFFDGVHRGHQFLINKVADEAKKLNLETTIITFVKHPRAVLQSSYIPKLLTAPEKKIEMLLAQNIDNCVELEFNENMAKMTAKVFMKKILKNKLNVKKLIIGYDNKFGHNREEGYNEYVTYGKQLGIEVEKYEGLDIDGTTISSSYIRNLIQTGNISLANRCLGYDYAISSHVIEGFQKGRTIGFPTANIDLNTVETILPGNGVYITNVKIENCNNTFNAMTNIGIRPTFNGTNTSIETHILNLNENIYGRMIYITFKKWLREEKKFISQNELKKAMQNDYKTTQLFFKQEKDKLK